MAQYETPTRKPGEDYAICYFAPINYLTVLQYDRQDRVQGQCDIVNNHEEANGRPRKFFIMAVADLELPDGTG